MFIELTTPMGKPRIVNTAAIAVIDIANSSGTPAKSIIETVSGNEYYVTETVDQIKNFIKMLN